MPVPKVTHITIHPSFISKACDHLYGQGARFVISVATDFLAKTNRLEVSHIFSFDEDCLTVVIRSQACPLNPSLDSISPVISAANWAERECRDLLGVDFIGHPDPSLGIIVVLAVLVAIAIDPPKVLLGIGVLYALSEPVYWLWRKVHKLPPEAAV